MQFINVMYAVIYASVFSLVIYVAICILNLPMACSLLSYLAGYLLLLSWIRLSHVCMVCMYVHVVIGQYSCYRPYIYLKFLLHMHASKS